MEPDLALVLGLIVAVFSLPSILSAVSDGRAPRASAVTILIAGGLLLYAVEMTPGGYKLSEIPDIFVQVAGRYMP